MAPRSVAKDVTISMGPFLSTRVSLYGLANMEDAKETKTSLVCPDCPEDNTAKMEQFYVASCGHVPEGQTKGFKTGECAKGVQVGETWKKVDEAALAEAKASDLAKNQIELLVRPAAEVDNQTWPTGSSYWAEPAKGGEKVLGVFAELAANPEYAVLGLLIVKGVEKLYRLRLLNGGIVLQQVLRPQEMNQFSANLPAPTAQERQTLDLVVAGQVEAFDPEAFRSQTVERMKAILAEAGGGSGATITALPTKPDTSGDVMAALEAMLAANQERKSA